MHLQRIALAGSFAAAIAAMPLAQASAQYYPPPCSPFPLTWPFCIVGAAVGVATTVVTAPFRAAAGPYYYYPQPYYGTPAASYAPYPPPAYPAYPAR